MFTLYSHNNNVFIVENDGDVVMNNYEYLIIKLLDELNTSQIQNICKHIKLNNTWCSLYECKKDIINVFEKLNVNINVLLDIFKIYSTSHNKETLVTNIKRLYNNY